MTAYYVASTGDNSDGLTWNKAFTTFAGAVTAATGDGDFIYIDQGFTDTVSATTVYAFANNVNVICSNDTAHEPPQTLGYMSSNNWIGHSTTTYRMTLQSKFKIFFYGITIRQAGSASNYIFLNWLDGGHFEFKKCYFWLGTGSASSLNLNVNSLGVNVYSKYTDCVFHFGHTGQCFAITGAIDFQNCSVSGDGSVPSTLFKIGGGASQATSMQV